MKFSEFVSLVSNYLGSNYGWQNKHAILLLEHLDTLHNQFQKGPNEKSDLWNDLAYETATQINQRIRYADAT